VRIGVYLPLRPEQMAKRRTIGTGGVPQMSAGNQEPEDPTSLAKYGTCEFYRIQRDSTSPGHLGPLPCILFDNSSVF